MADTDQALNNLQMAIKTAAGKGSFALNAAFLEKGLSDSSVTVPAKYDDVIHQAFQIEADKFNVDCSPDNIGTVTDGRFTVTNARIPFIGGLLDTPAGLVFSTTQEKDGTTLVVQIETSPKEWSWQRSFPFMGGWPFDHLPLGAVRFVFSTADGTYPWGKEGGLAVQGGAKQNLRSTVPLPELAKPFLALFGGLNAPSGNLDFTGVLDLSLYGAPDFTTGALLPTGTLTGILIDAEFTFAGYLAVRRPALTLTIPAPVDALPASALLWDAATQTLLEAEEVDLDVTPSLALSADLQVKGAKLGTYQIQVMLFPATAGLANSYNIALAAGDDGPRLSPAAAIDLMGGGSYFQATPPVLQQFLASFGLNGLSMSGALSVPPSVNQVSVQLGSAPGLDWQPIPAPTPDLAFSIKSFSLDWTVYHPFSRVPGERQYSYLFNTSFTLLPEVFRQPNGKAGGEFSVEFTSDLLFDARFDGTAKLSEFLGAVSDGYISLPSTIAAEVSDIHLMVDGKVSAFSFYCGFSVELSFLTVDNHPILSMTGGQVSLSGISPTAKPTSGNLTTTPGGGTAWAGSISGLLKVGDFYGNISIAYDGQQTPARWNLSASLAQPITVQALIKQFFAVGGVYDFPDFLPGTLTLNTFAVTATLPSGKATPPLATRYSVDTTFSWLFKLGEQQVGLQKAGLGIKYDGAKPRQQQFSGSATATWIYDAIRLKLTFGYTFQPTAQGRNDTLFATWEGFTATYTSNQQQQQQQLRFTLSGWSLGTLIQTLVRTLGDPYFSLPAPWDILNQISLDGLAIIVSLKSGEKNRLSGSYTLSKPLNLGFIVINSLVLRRDTDGKVTLAIDGTVPAPLQSSMGNLLDSEKGQDVQKMPSVPGQGTSYFKVFLLVLGQRIGIYESSDFSSTQAAIKALAKVPSTTGGDNPVNPKSTVPGQPYYNASNNWLIATHLGVLQVGSVWTVDLQLVFNDPNLYGLRLALNGDKAGGLAGLVIDILYKKITDDIGLFQIDFTFPDSVRNLNFGAVSVILPMIGIQIYTNGDFFIDIGFPRNLDFTRSFSFSAIVYGVPVLGSGGVYFGKLSNATATQVPKTNKGTFNPIIVFGLGLQIGLGYNFVKGPLKAGFALTVFGIIEGVFATFHPYTSSNLALPAPGNRLSADGGAGTLQQSHYFLLRGTVGIIGLLYGEIEYKIVSASLLVNITLSVQLVYESYRAIPLTATASVKVSLKVKIDLGAFSISIQLSFAATVSATFLIGEDGVAPWDNHTRLARGYARRYLPLELRATKLMGTMPRPRPRRLAENPAKPTLTLVAAPQFTVLAPEGANAYSQQQGAFVCLLAMDAPDPTAPTSPKAALAAEETTTSFESLCAGFFPWLIDLFEAGDVDTVDLALASSATVTHDKLQEDLQSLADPAQAPFGIKDLLQFLADGFTLDIHNQPPAGFAGGTIFPLFDGLLLTLPDPAGGTGTRTVTLETYVTANEDYRNTVADLMRQVSASIAARRDYQTFFLEEQDAVESMAAFVFVDAFSIIGRGLLQAGIDAFDNYAYPVSANDSIAGIVSTLNAYGNALRPDDISLPNAQYPLSAGISLSLEGLTTVIQANDTLDSIAVRYSAPAGDARWQTTPAALIQANGAARILRAGVSFAATVSRTSTPYTTQPGDSFNAIAQSLGITLPELAAQSVLYTLPGFLMPTGVLAIPTLTYVTAPGAGAGVPSPDTLNSVATAFATTVSAVGLANAEVTGLFASGTQAPGHLAIAHLDALPVAQLWSGIVASGAVGQVAGQLARFMAFGLRLPQAPGLSLSAEFLYPTQQREYALYQLTGQQFPTPAQASDYQITLARAASSHGIDLGFIQFDGTSNSTSTTINLKDAFNLLQVVLTYAQNGKFVPAPSFTALPLALPRPKQFPAASYALWATSDRAALTRVTTEGAAPQDSGGIPPAPTLWALPQGLLSAIQDRQATLQVIFGSQYAAVMSLLPRYRPRRGTTPPNSPVTVFNDLTAYAYAARVDFQITRLPATAVAGKSPQDTSLATATLTTVYQLLGPSAVDSQRLQFLLSAMATYGEALVSGLFLLYNEGGSDTITLTGRADTEFLSFITQTNLSTESHPPSAPTLLRAQAPLSGIANTSMQFIKLLWEQSVVRGGGYYLFWEELDSGSGLPAAIFDATGTATLTLVATLSNPGQAGLTDVVPNFVNALVTTDAIDPHQNVVVVESRPGSGNISTSGAADETLASIAATYGVGIGRLVAANATLPLASGAQIPINGILRQLTPADVKDPTQTLANLASYYSVGAVTPLTAAAIAAYNPGVAVAVGATFAIPPVTYQVGMAAGGPGTFDSLAAYYGLTLDAMAVNAAATSSLFPAKTILTIDTQTFDTQATLDPGNLSFLLTRANPGTPADLLKGASQQQQDDYAAATLYSLYNTLSAGLGPDPFFGESPFGLPFGPQDHGQDHDGDRTLATVQDKVAARGQRLAALAEQEEFTYRQALGYGGKDTSGQPFARINPAPASPPAGLPPASDNPYIGIGTYATIKLRWQDLFGNTMVTPFEVVPTDYSGALNDPPIALRYTDRLIGLAAWPKLQASYLYTGAAGQPSLAITFRLDGTAYSQNEDAARDLAVYQRLYFQLNQDYTGLGVPGVSDNAVRMTLSNSLLAEPEVNLDATQAQVIRDFVAACIRYLQGGCTGTAPSSTLTLPVPIAGIATSNRIALDVALTFTRQALLVDPVIAALPGGLAVTSPILPATDDVRNQSSSYMQFATALESCLQTPDWFMKVGAGLTQAGTSGGQRLQQLYAVRFGRTAGQGISFTIGKTAGYYAPLPLATSLESRTVTVNTYPDKTPVTMSFSGVDLNLWFDNCLDAIDKFLSPTYASSAYLLDKMNQIDDPLKDSLLGQVLSAKQSLADSISQMVSPILSTTPDDPATQSAAAETMRQQLLTTLGPAFAAGAVVVFGLDNISEENGVDPQYPPCLYGQPVAAGGAGTGKNQNYTLSQARIPLAAKASLAPRLSFLFTSKNVQGQAYVPLDMTYRITHMEFDRMTVPGIEKYIQSQWLIFINGPFDYALGKGTQYIPVINRALPIPPTVRRQSASATFTTDTIKTPADLAAWDYGFTYTYPQAAQDAVNVTIVLNVPTGLALALHVPEADLFTALADFVSNYPAISADLDRYLVKIDGRAVDQATVDQANQAVQAFADRGSQVAKTYAERFGGERLAALAGDTSVPVSFDVRLEADADGNALCSLLNVTIAGQAATYQAPAGDKPGTIISADDEITLPAPIVKIKPNQYQAMPVVPPPGKATLAYRYPVLPPASGSTLSFADALADPDREIFMHGLNAMVYKNARSSLFVQRNKYLFPDTQVGTVQTMGAFLFQTPVVRFTDPILPRLTWPAYPLRQVQPVEGTDVTAYMRGFFQGLFSDAAGEIRITMTGGYSYNLIPDLPALPRTVLPLNLLPPQVVAIDPANPPAPALALTAQVADWYTRTQPTQQGAAAMNFRLSLFSDAGPEQLLLSVDDLYWTVSS